MSAELPELIRTFGPVVLFAMAFAETAVLVGILVPSGTALAVAVALSMEGVVSLPVAMLASATGAMAGDSAGYWLGRRGGGRLLAAPGRIAGVLRRYEGLTARLFQRHAGLSVTIGRPIPYVRSLLPATVGMNRMPYGRFLLFDAFGIVLWVLLYLALGLVGGQGWRWMSEQVGTGWAVGVLGAVLLAWLGWRYRQGRLLIAAEPVDQPGPETG